MTVGFVRPEVALLFKAKAPRFKDQRDFDRVLPRLDRAARSWLASGLAQAYPGTPGRNGRKAVVQLVDDRGHG